MATTLKTTTKLYRLIGADGNEYLSKKKGLLGGHRRTHVYGRLDCPSALRYIELSLYSEFRVFFADEPTAIAAGYRPCATCMPAEYARWRPDHNL